MGSNIIFPLILRLSGRISKDKWKEKQDLKKWNQGRILSCRKLYTPWNNLNYIWWQNPKNTLKLHNHTLVSSISIRNLLIQEIVNIYIVSRTYLSGSFVYCQHYFVCLPICTLCMWCVKDFLCLQVYPQWSHCRRTPSWIVL